MAVGVPSGFSLFYHDTWSFSTFDLFESMNIYVTVIWPTQETSPPVGCFTKLNLNVLGKYPTYFSVMWPTTYVLGARYYLCDLRNIIKQAVETRIVALVKGWTRGGGSHFYYDYV